MTDTVRPISPEVRENVILRLRRIEGQVRGIQRMVEEGKDCRKIVNQIAAVKAALTSTSCTILECYTRNCLRDGSQSGDEIASELIEVIHRSTK
jgi:DNA-binding FrmR family transcriptional regulator